MSRWWLRFENFAVFHPWRAASVMAVPVSILAGALIGLQTRSPASGSGGAILFLVVLTAIAGVWLSTVTETDDEETEPAKLSRRQMTLGDARLVRAIVARAGRMRTSALVLWLGVVLLVSGLP